MIIDTSALVAILRGEAGAGEIAEAIGTHGGLLPAPALVEFCRVTSVECNRPSRSADALLTRLAALDVVTIPFGEEDARIAAEANERWGTGNGRGGPLNILDLMVYAVSRRTGRPILCTGRDFAATDAPIHPASRS